MADDNPFAQYAEASPGGAGDNPFAKFKTPDAPPASAPFLKGTTASGVAGAAGRGLAPYAAGAALGAAAGAPFAGVGAVPGAIAGMGAVGLEELVSAVSKLGNKTLGTPAVGSVSDITDKALDAIGTKRPSTGIEQAVQTGAGMVGGLPVAGPAAAAGAATGKGAGYAASELIGGLGTHTGGESIRQALKAGAEGGTRAKAFLDAMRGKTPMENVITTAKQALQSMRQAKNASYQAGMAGVKGDPAILKFDDIDKAITKASDIGNFHGVPTNPKADQAVNEAADLVRVWKSKPQDQFHTAYGLDNLKQAIGSILETIPFEAKQARLAVQNIYNAAKNTVSAQAPGYAKTMKDYEAASTQLKELESSFKLGNKSSADTALRRLQSVMRNNVNANYGNRLELAKMMEANGGKNLLPELAGQSLSSNTPRGLGGAVGGMNLGAIATALGTGRLGEAAAGTMLLPFQSPRAMGEAAYGIGAAGRHIGNWWDAIKP